MSTHASTENPHAPRVLLKAGDYAVQLIHTQVESADDGNTSILHLQLEVLSDGHRGTVLEHAFVVRGGRGREERDGQALLEQLIRLAGLNRGQRLQHNSFGALRGAQFTVRVRTVGGTHREQDNGPRMNVITEWSPSPMSRTLFLPTPPGAPGEWQAKRDWANGNAEQLELERNAEKKRLAPPTHAPWVKPAPKARTKGDLAELFGDVERIHAEHRSAAQSVEDDTDMYGVGSGQAYFARQRVGEVISRYEKAVLAWKACGRELEQAAVAA